MAQGKGFTINGAKNWFTAAGIGVLVAGGSFLVGHYRSMAVASQYQYEHFVEKDQYRHDIQNLRSDIRVLSQKLDRALEARGP